MTCWYCYWGWPKEVYDIYKEGYDKCGDDMHFGPAHIVWEDENFDSAQWCLDNFDEYSRDLPSDSLDAIRESLEKLLALPDHIREAMPKDYDGENPHLYPPADGLVMVRV